MKHQFSIAIIVFSTCFISSCNLLSPTPPKVVEQGYKVGERFYCEVDGKPFRPNNGGDLFLSSLVTDFYTNKQSSGVPINYIRYVISAFDSRRESNVESVSLIFLIPFEIKNNLKFQINKDSNLADIFKRDPTDRFVQNQFKPISGEILITKIDTINFKISGEFQFTSYRVNKPSEISKIENGHFNNLSFPYPNIRL